MNMQMFNLFWVDKLLSQLLIQTYTVCWSIEYLPGTDMSCGIM